MKRSTMTLALTVCLLAAGAVYAARGLSMKCQAQPEKDPATGKTGKPCGFESEVTFGGGMFFDQITGYCRACKKFVYVQWTRENAPVPANGKTKPRPKPLGEVWDAATGQVLTIHACPHCKGPFLEIKSVKDLKHCPACNQPHFAIDKSKPEMAID